MSFAFNSVIRSAASVAAALQMLWAQQAPAVDHLPGSGLPVGNNQVTWAPQPSNDTLDTLLLIFFAANLVLLLFCCLQGTIAYMAPEVLHTTAGHYDGKKADIWSCGVVLYTMLVGGMPFKSTKTDNLGQMVVSLLADMRSQRFALPHTLSANAQDLLRRLLHPNPQQRITMADITTHPWFSVGLPSNALSMNDSYLQLPRSCMQSEEEICNIVAKASMSEQQLIKDQDREAAPPSGLVVQPQQQHVPQLQPPFQQLPVQQQQQQQQQPSPQFQQQQQAEQHHVQMPVPMQQEQQAEQQLQQQQLPYAVV
jgi:serine/threonine protein kinase